jgi:hypothetical protein
MDRSRPVPTIVMISGACNEMKHHAFQNHYCFKPYLIREKLRRQSGGRES